MHDAQRRAAARLGRIWQRRAEEKPRLSAAQNAIAAKRARSSGGSNGAVDTKRTIHVETEFCAASVKRAARIPPGRSPLVPSWVVFWLNPLEFASWRSWADLGPVLAFIF